MGRGVGLEAVSPRRLAATGGNAGGVRSAGATLVRQGLVCVAAATGRLALPAIARQRIVEALLELLTAVPGALVLTLAGPVVVGAGRTTPVLATGRMMVPRRAAAVLAA